MLQVLWFVTQHCTWKTFTCVPICQDASHFCRTCRIPLLQDALHLGCLVNAVILRAEEPYFVIDVDGSLLSFARARFHISV